MATLTNMATLKQIFKAKKLEATTARSGYQSEPIFTVTVDQEESHDPNDWQADRSVLQCNKHMFQQQINCDVTFLFNKDNGQECSISAHSYILASRSSVFFAMLMGPAKEHSNTIKIPDAEKEAFAEMLRFMYYEEVTLNGDNVMAILYLARKYFLKHLLKKCNDFLMKNLDTGNVCSILPYALHLEEHNLVKRCFNIIDSQTKEVLDSQSFLSISRELLGKVIERDTLRGACEINIFHACQRWAESECERNGWESNAANKRQALGNVLNLIRFPVMPLEIFSNEVTTTDLLNKDESLSVFLYLTRKDKTYKGQLLFGTKLRASGTQRNKHAVEEEREAEYNEFAIFSESPLRRGNRYAHQQAAKYCRRCYSSPANYSRFCMNCGAAIQ